MKREIKFRGKSTDTGKWVYGFLSFFYTAGRDENGLIFTDKARIYSPEDGCCYDVWAETVGQFTGLRDKNKTKIYEGDISRMNYATEISDDYDCYAEEGQYVGVVVITANKGVCLNPCVKNGLYKTRYKPLSAYRSEVIGNIFDNPDLV